ncbi:hypothetical protein VARIO8X_150036 [Burkholderiales bacterium 8X]|nr:hypothetical protein VARIO8X_150036 [Burkholderiales bacterium 8X]
MSYEQQRLQLKLAQENILNFKSFTAFADSIQSAGILQFQ